MQMQTAVVGQRYLVDAAAESAEVSTLFKERSWIRWAKGGVDLLSLQLSLYLACLLSEFNYPWHHAVVGHRLYFEVSTALLLLPLGYWLAGLYPGYGLALAERLRRRVRVTVIFYMAFSLWWFFVHHDIYSRLFTILAFMLSLLIPPMMQHLLRSTLTRHDLWGTPVLIVGAGRTGARAVSSLLNNPDLGFKPVAVVDDDETKWHTSLSGIKVIGGLSWAGVFRGKVKYALVARPGMPREQQVRLINGLPFPHILIIPDLIGVQSLWVAARDLCGMVGLELHKNLLMRKNIILKCCIDYCLALPVFLLSLPVVTLFAAWIYCATGANPFYCQVREGKGGKKFKVWKLRTMYPDAESLLQQWLETHPEAKQEWELHFKLKDDPRILKGIGHFLRKSSIDELPQLWNVLRGEMSLVGPRPFPHYHLEQFGGEFRNTRRQVLPGMTGLWQVSARSDGDLAVQEKLDTYYILNWSIWLDLSLLGHTMHTVLTGKGAY